MAGTTTYYGISYPTSTDYVKDGASAMQTIATGFDTAVAIPTYNNQTGTTYTFVLADAAKVVSANNASAVTFTIPPQSSVTWATGTTLTVTNLGAGTLTIAGGSGVTVTNSGSTVSQYGSASIIRTGSDAWTVIPFVGGAALLSDGAISGTTGSPTTATYTSGGVNYKTYTWTGSGSITLAKSGLVDLLIVGGGGAGGGAGGGGGGAGQVSEILGAYLPNGTTTVTVGAGAAADPYFNGIPGSPTLVNYYYAVGGGGGGNAVRAQSGQNGGNGGGASTAYSPGVTNVLTGFSGGSGNSGGFGDVGGGGGGASANGSNASTTAGGNGGNGVAKTLRNNTSVTYGGGGGGAVQSVGSGGTGGTGGGGTGGGGSAGTAGTANTGGGGGGGGSGVAYAGGSGIAIIRVRA